MAFAGGKGWLIVPLAGALCALAGCINHDQNPSYFPFLLPAGPISQTHAKPVGPGYYADFDPYAIRLEVRPVQQTNPVGTQHVLVATVYDKNNVPRRNRRVEWLVEGVGNILEVDESGWCPGRGYKVDNKYAVSYTNYGTHLMTRGNGDPRDDFELRPGQSWCTISSAVEGDTYVTVYAPGIANWDRRKVTVSCRWVDAFWTFPESAAVRTGAQHVFTTRVFKHTTREPLANYLVRYKIIDGPAAVLLPNRTQEMVAISDLEGKAQVAIAQQGPALGSNRVEIEIIRPPDPTKPSGTGITLAKAFATVEWLAPNIAMTHTGPANVVLGDEATYTIVVNNTGKVESKSMTVTNAIPDGLEFVRSSLPNARDGQNLIFTAGTLPFGQAYTVQVTFKAARPGTVNNCASVVTEEGLKDEKCVATQITRPQLAAEIKGPQTGVVGVPVNFDVTLTNPGSGPANKVFLKVELDKGLEPQGLPAGQEASRVITSDQNTLAPQESRVVALSAIPREQGPQTVKLTVTAEGGLTATAQATVQIARPQVGVKINGPKSRYMDRIVEWNIRVANPGPVTLNSVLLRDPLPTQLTFESATEGGLLKNGEVVWDLGTLPPGKERVVQVTTRAGKTPGPVNHTAVVSSDFGLRAEDMAQVEILATPAALKLEVVDVGDPVQVGKQIEYQIEVTNTGAQPVRQVKVIATLPPELKIVNTQGPAPKIEGQSITFGLVDTLPAGQTQKYTIKAEGKKAGDVRFEAKLYADILKNGPITETESTNIVDPLGPLNGPPVPGLPPAPLPPGPGLTAQPGGAALPRNPIVPLVPPPQK